MGSFLSTANESADENVGERSAENRESTSLDQSSGLKQVTADHTATTSAAYCMDVDQSVDQSSSVQMDQVACAWEIDLAGFASTSKSKKPIRNNIKINANKVSEKEMMETVPVSMVTKEVIATRKVLDHRRWYCISRPQYKKSCGISSLVSCWNYLFSSLGTGSLQPLSQEEAMTVLGFKPPFSEIRFGPFTGNATLMRWFRQLCNHYKVRGRAYYLYKPKGKGRTVGMSSEDALQKLKGGLDDEQTAFIYHCHNHYFCPIGYEDTPIRSLDAYRANLTPKHVVTWVVNGDCSSRHPALSSVRWSDISTDLNCENPSHMNIRQLHKGVMQRKSKKNGGNLHSIMGFQRSTWQGIKESWATKQVPPTSVDIEYTDSDRSSHDSDD